MIEIKDVKDSIDELSDDNSTVWSGLDVNEVKVLKEELVEKLENK